jgi:hypothetical protein
MVERTSRAFYALLIAVAVIATVMLVNSESPPAIHEEVPQRSHAESHLAVDKVSNNKKPEVKETKAAVHGLQLDAVRKVEIEKMKHAAALRPLKIDAQEKKKIQSLVATVSEEFQSTTVKSKAMAKAVKKAAHQRSATLQHHAKAKAATVVAQARKALKAQLTTLSKTLTASVDARQQAAEKLKQLQAKQADEVELAEAQLQLAKVNKATHNANNNARQAAQQAHKKAARRINFARNMLATRLKAIQTTEGLTVSKAELQANVVNTEAEEALSKTRQQVLLEMDDNDDSISLAEIVGQDAVAEVPPKQRKVDQHLSGLSDDELLATADEPSFVDTIYTAKMGTCKFPFVYNGEKLYHCKQSKAGHWCATATDAAHEVKKWDYCVQNRKVVLLAKEAAMRAAKIEIGRVLTETGEGALKPAALRESLRAAAAARTAPKPSPQAQVPQQVPAESPALEDTAQATKEVDAMINGH